MAVLLTNKRCMEWTQTLPIQNVQATQKILPKIVKQSTHFICIIYPGKHNGTLLLTYEAHIEQLERKQILDQTTPVILKVSYVAAMVPA